MPPTIGPEAAQAVVNLRIRHRHAPLLDALALVMQDRQGVACDASAVWRHRPLGQVLAGVFDRGMTPSDWAVWTVPPADPS